MNQLLIIGLFVGMVVVILRFRTLNKKLHELLAENYQVGKILVRRDMELTDANTRLTALDQNKSEFVSVAAHQLRSPLTGIRWTLKMLLDRDLGVLNQDQQKMIEGGLQSAVRMIDLVNDLLDVAKIEEGRFGFTFRNTPPERLLEPLLQNLHHAADAKGVAVRATISPHLPSLSMDADKMAIALNNVFDNAVKYTPPGGAVTVSVTPATEGLEIKVTDTGIGIPEQQLRQVFTKFFRAENAVRFQTSGSGLGLYVVKNIIHSHGGTIDIANATHHGTVVTITLPTTLQEHDHPRQKPSLAIAHTDSV